MNRTAEIGEELANMGEEALKEALKKRLEEDAKKALDAGDVATTVVQSLQECPTPPHTVDVVAIDTQKDSTCASIRTAANLANWEAVTQKALTATAEGKSRAAARAAADTQTTQFACKGRCTPIVTRGAETTVSAPTISAPYQWWGLQYVDVTVVSTTTIPLTFQCK